MSYLINNDSGACGIYRGKLIQDGSTIRVYIPGMFSTNPFDNNGDLINGINLKMFPEIQWCCYNIESKDINNIDGFATIMFENGDLKKPICVSYAVIGSTNNQSNDSSNSNNSSNPNNSNPSNNNPSNDSTLDENGTWELLGNDFKITHYCACEKCCGKKPTDPGYGITASGTIVEEGRTIAVDKSLIPLGSKVKIDGHVYIAEDTGGAIKGHRIDIYISDHQRALDLGVKENVAVYLLTNNSNLQDNEPNVVPTGDVNIIEVNYNWSSTPAIRTAGTNYIVLHHTATTGDISAETIHSWHLNNGWSGIGYHFYIKKNGNIYRGRPIDTIGAHCQGSNSNSVGVAFEGNYESVDTEMPTVQFNAGRNLISYLKELYPMAIIKGHRDLGSSACPGKNFPFNNIISGL